MHLAEPRLYWRIKIADKKWKYVPAHIVPIEQTGGGLMAMISLPPASVADAKYSMHTNRPMSDMESDESE